MVGVSEDDKMERRSMISSAISPTPAVLASGLLENEDSSRIRPPSCSIASISDHSSTSTTQRDASLATTRMVETPAPIMTPVSSVGSMGQVSYCLQAPGGNQPIFITIPNNTQTQQPQTQPQVNSVTQTQTNINNQPAGSFFDPQNPPAYDVQQMCNFLQSFDSGELDALNVTGLMAEDSFSAVNADYAADDLFHRLLNDIMEQGNV